MQESMFVNISEVEVFIFTAVIGICTVLSFVIYWWFITAIGCGCSREEDRGGRSSPRSSDDSASHVLPVFRYLSILSMTCYNVFILLSFILYLIQSFYYLPASDVSYSRLLCQCEAYNVAFFMLGKECMYLLFMARVYFSFNSTSFAYSKRMLQVLTFTFVVVMAGIGLVYGIFMYSSNVADETIDEPTDCHNVQLSPAEQAVIYTGMLCLYFSTRFCV